VEDDLQKELEKLKIIYYEIIAGSSYVPSLNVYVKHFTELDNLEISKAKQAFLKKYKEEGVPFYKERKAILVENGEWSAEEDDKIEFLKTNIIDNEKNIRHIILEQQHSIREVIKDRKTELAKALFRKREIFGTTGEEFADSDTLAFVAFLETFNDAACTDRKFKTFQQFQDLSDEESQLYIENIDEALSKFTEENIKIIAAMPFFINIFSYVREDVSRFFKTALVNLSHFQFLILSIGSRNINTLSQIEGEPPELSKLEDIQNIVNFYDTEYSVMVGRRKSSKG
jgi:hypothetical protein